MPLTKAQRRKVNAQNAQASTGPHDTSRTRFNAMKHGLRAETLCLPGENPAAIQQRSDAWNDYYQPQDPAEQHLVNECVRATMLSDRIDRFHTAEVASQVRRACLGWESRQTDRREHALTMLNDDPARAVRDLKRFSFGLQHLIETWERLDEALVETGYWNDLERDEAIRLLGYKPEPKTLKQTPVAWITRLHALICRPNASELAFDWLFDRERLPDPYRTQYAPDFLPEAESCRRSLRAMIAEELQRLRIAEEELRTTVDDPDEAESVDRALILQDEKAARLFLRYHAESRTTFHRAYGALVRAIEARAEGPIAVADPPEPAPAPEAEAEQVEEAVSPPAPACLSEAVVEPAPEVSEAPFPNEANPAPEPSSTVCGPSPSVDPNARRSEVEQGARVGHGPTADEESALMERLYRQKRAGMRPGEVLIAPAGAGS